MNKITYGIKNLHYAKKTVDDGTVSYATPVPIPGATEIAMPPVGETVKVYADNIVYVKVLVNQGYDGNISVFELPESFLTDILGEIKDTNGMMVENAQAELGEFALLGEFATDTLETKKFVFYNCTAGRPEINKATKEESIDPSPLSVPIVATPLEGTEIIKASIVGTTENKTWEDWYKAVTMPTA